MNKLLLVFLALFLQINLLKSQESLYVAFFSCEDCKTQTGVSSTYLFTDFINGYGRYKALMAQVRDSSLQVENATTARESAELLSTNFFIVGRIVKLDDNYYISVMMYATESGLTVWRASELTDDLSDLPIILDKFAAHLAIDKKFSRQGDVYRVYSGETKRVEKKKVNVGIGMSTGGRIDLSTSNNSQVVPSLGGVLSFDGGRFIFEANYEHSSFGYSEQNGINYYNNSEIHNNYFINVIYPIRSTNSAPFACLGAGINFTEVSYSSRNILSSNVLTAIVDSRNENKLLVNGGIGYVLKRDSRAKIFFYGRGYLLFNNIEYKPEYGASINMALVVGK